MFSNTASSAPCTSPHPPRDGQDSFDDDRLIFLSWGKWSFSASFATACSGLGPARVYAETRRTPLSGLLLL
eukprot:3297942-Pyramimonas_sp.AAC.1